MIVYSLSAITILFALLSLLILRNSARRKLRYGWDGILCAAAMCAFILHYGAWVFVSILLKPVLLICFTIILINTLLNGRPYMPPAKPKKTRILLNLSFSAVFLVLTVLYYTGTTGKPDVLNISFPFKQGRYYVLQGGKGLPTNLFHYSLRGTIYAMDIVKLNHWGNRAKKIFSKNLNDYEIFGDTIYCPCNGRVLRAVDFHPDNIPPNRVTGIGQLNGILIEGDSFYLYMGHLKKGSLMVHTGDSVVTGQPLACAGNSGNTIEPHLHIQAHAKLNNNLPWYKEPPLFIKFNGKAYLLFQEMEVIYP